MSFMYMFFFLVFVLNRFSSYHGQKGTALAWLRAWDLPFSVKSGCASEMYGSVIGLTSRLTDGHMLEGQMSTYCIETGEMMDATSLASLSRDQQRKHIEQKVLEYGGTLCQVEGFVNGQTGELMQPLCTFYIRVAKLRHLVRDKYHTRARGQRQAENRQATDGKANLGGLRTGPMERDCLLSHGASATASERLDKLSDPFVTANCKNCEMPATFDESTGYGYCDLCQTDKFVVPVRTTYTTTLSLDQLFALCITTTSKTINEDITTTCNSSKWDPVERQQHETDQEHSMYKLSTMTALDRSIYHKYGLEEPTTYRTFMKTLPSLHRKSEYTNTMTKHSSRYVATQAQIASLQTETAAQALKIPNRGRKRKDVGGTDTNRTNAKRHAGDSATVGGNEAAERNSKMSALMNMLAPVKRTRKFTNH